MIVKGTIYFLLIPPILIFLILAAYLKIIKPFFAGRRYIKAELARAFDRDEYRYWKGELLKLYISLIPLIGKILIKFLDN